MARGGEGWGARVILFHTESRSKESSKLGHNNAIIYKLCP